MAHDTASSDERPRKPVPYCTRYTISEPIAIGAPVTVSTLCDPSGRTRMICAPGLNSPGATGTIVTRSGIALTPVTRIVAGPGAAPAGITKLICCGETRYRPA